MREVSRCWIVLRSGARGRREDHNRRWCENPGVGLKKAVGLQCCVCFFFSSRRRHTRCSRDWSSDVCSSDLGAAKRCLLPFVLEVNAPLVCEQQRFRGGMTCPWLARRIERLVWRGSDLVIAVSRSEERRVGKECRSRWSPVTYKNNKQTN